MTVKIQEKKIELKLSIRAYIYYENSLNKNFDPKDLSTFINLITFFYCVLIASAKKDNIDLSITFDELMGWLDENGGEEFLVKFVDWFIEERNKSLELARNNEDKISDTDKKK